VIKMKIRLILVLLLFFPLFVFAEELKPINLPAPNTKGGRPLMQALKERKSQREFSSKELPIQVLSDLLWAANGINRPEISHHTAPTSMNMQEIDIYVVKSDGAYLYDAENNDLIQIVSGDIRSLAGSQPFVKDAPLNLVYVADLSKMSRISIQEKDFYSATDTGFISQNVYLFCSSAGLATVVRGWVDKVALAKALKLRPNQKIILAQTIGYPK